MVEIRKPDVPYAEINCETVLSVFLANAAHLQVVEGKVMPSKSVDCDLEALPAVASRTWRSTVYPRLARQRAQPFGELLHIEDQHLKFVGNSASGRAQ